MFTMLAIWCSLVTVALAHNLPSGNSTVASQSSTDVSSSAHSVPSSTSSVAPSTSHSSVSSAASSPSTATSASSVSQSASPVVSSIFTPAPTHFKGKNPKRGLAFAAGDTPGDLINANQSQSVITWQYNWANLPPAYLATSNIKYIPMQWGSGGIDQFQDSVKAQGADTILAFNEPDFASEANMDPTQAAALWMNFIQPLKAQGIRLGGPAVTASGTGQPWLKTFFDACTNCTIDFLPLHWYGSGTEGFYNYLWEMHGLYPNIPIWITEYAETSTNDTVVLDFLNQTITYLDSLDWIERYSWFGFFRPKQDLHYNLLDANGGLNDLGKLYVGANTIHTQVTSNGAGFKTIAGGADSPSQGLVTTWPAFNGAVAGWNMGSNQMICILVALSSGILGGLWTIW